MTKEKARTLLIQIFNTYSNIITANYKDGVIQEAFEMAVEALADRKTEPNSSEKPNNCEKDCFLCKWLGDVDVCGRCRNRNLFAEADTEPTISKMEQVEDEPTTQTETQKSNLTFKTLEYCDICDHKGCEECIANALDEHCMPSQFNKQIEDECAKEYEELGLKELKELIEADRKTENSSEKPNNCEETDCDTCRYAGECDWEPWQECPYESKTEPTISKMEQVETEPQTDCAWK